MRSYGRLWSSLNRHMHMNSDDTCAVCGTETDYHKQQINDETLTRCKSCSPRLSPRMRRTETVLGGLFLVVVAPLVSIAHLWPGVTLWSPDRTFEKAVVGAGHDSSHGLVEFHLYILRLTDLLFEVALTLFSLLTLGVYVLIALWFITTLRSDAA